MKYLIIFCLITTQVSASVEALIDHVGSKYPPETLKYDWDGAVLLWAMAKKSQQENYDGSRLVDMLKGYYQKFEDQNVNVTSPDLAAPALGAAFLQTHGVVLGQSIINKAQEFLITEPRNELGALNHVGHRHRFKPWLPLTRRFVRPSIWGDSMVMYVLNGFYIAKSQNDRILMDFIQNQPIIFTDYLQAENGLYSHAYWTNSKMRWPKDGAWLRGHGWVMAALVDLIDEGVPGIKDSFIRAANSVIAHQKINGMYSTIIEKDFEDETSGTALVSYALAKGARLGILGQEHKLSAEKSWLSLQDRVVKGKDGIKLVGCSGYTNAMPYSSWYSSILVRKDKETPFCIGAFLLASTELGDF